MSKPTVLISGGTGSIGSYLIPFLTEKGYACTVLTRNIPKEQLPQTTYALWDIENQTIDRKAIETADFIIHLAGANVAEKRWTDKRKKEILESRTKSAGLLVSSLRTIPNKVKLFISASAIGYYGPDTKLSKKTGFKEDAPPSEDFLGQTCMHWEDSVKKAGELPIETVIFRQGIVLTEEDGALQKFMQPLTFGIATILGNGKQTISWIHVRDLCRMYLLAMESRLSGVFNAVSPNPVSNESFVLSLANKKRGKSFIPVHVPKFVLKLALGEMSIEVLKSATVSSDKIRSKGFQFVFPSTEAAFSDLLK